MLVDGRRTLVETIKVNINPLDVHRELFHLWCDSVCKGADGMRNGMWYTDDEDYHSSWKKTLREATEEEICKYKAFDEVWRTIVKLEGIK